MKGRILIVSGLCFVMVALFSCSKYEEGPGLSFRSKTKRLANSWRISSVTVNGVEQSGNPFFSKQKHYIYESGEYNISIVDPFTQEVENVNGQWKFYDDDEKMAVNFANYNGVADSLAEFRILKLKEKSLWLRSLDNSVEYHFTPFDEPGRK